MKIRNIITKIIYFICSPPKGCTFESIKFSTVFLNLIRNLLVAAISLGIFALLGYGLLFGTVDKKEAAIKKDIVSYNATIINHKEPTHIYRSMTSGKAKIYIEDIDYTGYVKYESDIPLVNGEQHIVYKYKDYYGFSTLGLAKNTMKWYFLTYILLVFLCPLLTPFIISIIIVFYDILLLVVAPLKQK